MTTFDSRPKRVWAVLTGSWALLCLLLATPFSWEMLNDESMLYVIFSYIFLSLSPFIPFFHNWIFQHGEHRGLLFIAISLFALVFLFVASGARGDEEFTIISSIAWWFIFTFSYFLFFEINPIHALTKNKNSENRKKQITKVKLGILFSFIFGWALLQTPYLLRGTVLIDSSPHILDQVLFQLGFTLAGVALILVIAIVGSCAQSAIKKSWDSYGTFFFLWAFWFGFAAVLFSLIIAKELEIMTG